MRCMTGYACINNYAYFSSWEQGYQAYYALLKSTVYVGSGLTTIETIIPKWAPPSDGNDDSAYIASVLQAKNSYE